MTDLTPDQWPNYYLPSSSEWRSAFSTSIASASGMAKTYTDAQVAALNTSVAGSVAGQIAAVNQTITTQIGTVNTTATALASTVATLSAAAVRNPAVADQNMGAYLVRNQGQGLLGTDGARLDQVGWIQIGGAVSAAGTQAVSFTLASTYRRFRLEWSGLGGGNDLGTFYGLFSTNNGVSFDTGNSYQYGLTTTTTAGATSTFTTGVTSTIRYNSAQTGLQNNEGSFEFGNASQKGLLSNVVGTSTSIVGTQGWINYTPGSATNILIGINAGIFSSGLVRLLGWKS